jgi:hypothetical protein
VSTWTPCGDAALILRRPTRPVKEQEAALFDVLREFVDQRGEGPT